MGAPLVPVVGLLTMTMLPPKDPAYSEPKPGYLRSFAWGDAPIPTSGEIADLYQPVEDEILKTMRTDGFVGAGIVLIRDGKIVACRGYGYSELPGKPFIPTTTVRTCSVSKSITGIASLLAVQDKRIAYDDLVVPILASVGIKPFLCEGRKFDERWNKVTFGDILRQCAGNQSNYYIPKFHEWLNASEPLGIKKPANAKQVASLILGSDPLSSDPGTKFEYKNSNFALAARILEAAWKKPFAAGLKEAMKRLGVPDGDIHVSMHQTSPTSRKRGRREAHYYARRKFEDSHGTEAYNDGWGFSSEVGDGCSGIAASVRGLGALLLNLVGKSSAFSPSTFSHLLAPPAYIAKAENFNPKDMRFYSLGIDVHVVEGRLVGIWHGGMTLHSGAVIGTAPDGTVYAALTNCNFASGAAADARMLWAIERGLKAVSH